MSFKLKQTGTQIEKTAEDLKVLMTEDSEVPGLPETRDKTVAVPGRNGAYDFGADLGPRPFTLELAFIYASSREELQQHIRELVNFISDDQGKPRLMELVFDMEPGKKYFVRYSGNLPLERLAYWSIGEMPLPLTAWDPHAYSDLNIKSFNVSEDPEAKVVSEGNVEARTKIVIANKGDQAIEDIEISRYVEY